VEHDLEQRPLAPLAREVLDEPHASGRGPSAVEDHAPFEPRDRLVVWPPAHGRVVDLLHAIARVRQARGEIAVVGEKQQALRVVVEPSYREEVFAGRPDQLDDRGATLRVGAG